MDLSEGLTPFADYCAFRPSITIASSEVISPFPPDRVVITSEANLTSLNDDSVQGHHGRLRISEIEA